MRTHPPVYYTVRSFVRFAVWMLLVAIFLGGCTALSLSLDEPPRCDVHLSAASTWTADHPVNLSRCTHPDGILLNADGTWQPWDETVNGPRP